MNIFRKKLISRAVTTLVLASFLFGPIAALAEDGVGLDGSNSERLIMTQEEAESKSQNNTGTYDPNEQLNLSKSVGNGINHKTAKDLVNKFTGAAVYSYDIVLPEGRNKQTPKLSLSYSSQRKNSQTNIYGFGWELNSDYISRDLTSGQDNIYSKNYFVVSGQLDNGRLNKVASTTNSYRMKTAADYKEYEYNEDTKTWAVKDSLGNLYTFGSSDDSRIASSTNSNLIYKWMLEKVEDTNGNLIVYHYFKDDGQIYLKKINYTAGQGSGGEFEVRFKPFCDEPTDANRDDIRISYVAGIKMVNKFKLDEIEVAHNNTPIKRVHLNFTASLKTKTLTLTSISESNSQDGQTWSAKPISSFEYDSINYEDIWNNGTTNTELPLMNLLVGNQRRFIFQNGDINGDGILDFVNTHEAYLSEPSSTIGYISRPNGTWEEKLNWTDFPEVFQYDPQDYQYALRGGAETMDLNGDGKADIFRSSRHYENGNTKDIKRLYSNNGNNTWSLNASSSIPFILAGNLVEAYRFADINNDGLIDAILSYDAVGSSGGHPIHVYINSVYLNDGNGFVEKPYYSIPEPFAQISTVYGNSSNTGTQLIDLNGDGLVDLVRSIYEGPDTWVQRAFINTGESFVAAPEWNLPVFLYKARDFGQPTPSYDNGTRFVDVNADGLVDIVQSMKNDNLKKLFINNGSGWSEINNPHIPYDITYYNEVAGGTTNYTGDVDTRIIDFNGDGVDDMYNLWATGTRVRIAQFPKEFLLKKVNEGYGGQINLYYKSSYDYKDENGNSKNLMLRPQIVLDKLTTNNGLGDISQVQYEYANGYYYQDPNNLSDRQFAGFGKVGVTEENKKTINYFHQSGGFDGSQLGEYQDNEDKIGLLYRQEVYDTSDQQNKIVLTNIDKWKTNNFGNTTYIFKDQSTKIVYKNINEYSATINKYNYDPATNVLTQEDNLGLVNANALSGDLIQDIPGDEQTINYDYAAPTSDLPIVTAVKQKTLSASTESTTYRQQSYYDDLPYGQVSKNNKTKDDFLFQQIDQQYVYDNYGLPIKQIDPLGKETNYEYDSSHLYPIKIINSLNQATNISHNYLGLPTLTVDPNGLREEKTYDAFGRLLTVSKSAPNDPNTMIMMERYVYNDFSLPRIIKKETRVDDQHWLASYQYYDGLGQLIQTRSQHDNINFAIVSQKYDQFGRVIKTTLPYLGSGYVYQAEDWNGPVVEKEYDALDRVTKEIVPSGQTIFSYDGFITTIIDAKGIQKKLERDAYDRLVGVEEFIGDRFVRTSYDYNLLSKLTKITDSQGNIRNFIYDDLGRLLQQDDAHRQSSQGYNWLYEYDKSSHLIKQIDANGQQTDYFYDDLGRITKEQSDSGIINYYYDTGENAIGRLVKINSAYGVGYEKNLAYDLWGLVMTEQVSINSRAFNTAYGYTLTGQTASINLPNGKTVVNQYDDQGRFKGFVLSGEDLAPTEIISNVAYHVSGRPQTVTYANGTITNYDYDSQTQRLVNKATNVMGNKIQDLNYVYDSLGNIVELNDNSDTVTAKSVVYDYDSLSRLIRATAIGTANWEQLFSYDDLGNILEKNDIGEYKYTNYNPHQASLIGRFNYYYDKNGNVIDDGIYDYVYNSANRLISATAKDNSLISNYSYDPAGSRTYKKVERLNDLQQRMLNGLESEQLFSTSTPTSTEEIIIEQQVSSTTPTSTNPLIVSATMNGGDRQLIETYYPNQFYELTIDNNNETSTIHVYGLGQRLAQVDTSSDNNDQIKPIFTDHLGSTQQVTNLQGHIIASYDYYPFGGVREGDNADPLNKKGFINKELDETNLNYDEARYLNADVGRFNEADNAVLNVAIDKNQNSLLIEPQKFNEYSYSINNPLKYIDNDGNNPIVAALIVSCVAICPEIAENLQMMFMTPVGMYALDTSFDALGNKNSSNTEKILAFMGLGIGIFPLGSTISSVRTALVAKYFQKIANYDIDQVVNLNALYKANQGFEFTGRPWSIGEASDSIGSLVGHFFKHGNQVGARNIEEYYNMANKLIKSEDGKNVYKLNDLYGPGTVDYFDLKTNNLVGLNKRGEISSFQRVFQQDKLNKILNAIKTIK